MKNKKIILLIMPLLLTSCQNNQKILYLGEPFLLQNSDLYMNLEEHFNQEINHEFTSSNFFIKDFYNQLEKDALNLVTSNRISEVLKQSNKIIFNVGNYELLRLIEYKNYSFSYNSEVIKTSREMFDYYFHQSLDILVNYTQDIVIIPMYNPLLIKEEYRLELNELINSYNKIIQDNCTEFNVKYVNIDKMSSFVYQDNHISESGYDYLIKKIEQVYGSD